jgi:SAM-dependent methyltransferase
MRPHAKTKLGFYPLPVAEAKRLRKLLTFPDQFSALDPCVGDGVAFSALLADTSARRYGIEVDAYRAEQARSVAIETLQANAMDVRCAAESLSLIYLNPPYDFEAGKSGNQRLEAVFLEHVYRWLKPAGVLVFVLPQRYLQNCARLLADHFTDIRVYKLTDPECVKYNQVAVFAARRKRGQHLSDAELAQTTRSLEVLAESKELPDMGDNPAAVYVAPTSTSVALTNTAIPLDEVEDLLLSSSVYRQISRLLLRDQDSVRGRPLTPLHGGHVGLLCTAGMLNGVFGDGNDRHIGHWRSVKFVDHWEEDDEDGTKILHDRERFSHELTLIFADGSAQILTHEKKKPS